MAWDDTQTSSDSITYTEWNNMVTFIKGLLKNQDSNGSACSGSDGATGRVLTLNNSGSVNTTSMQVYRNGAMIVPADLTLGDSGSATVTFTSTNIWDTDKIRVIYSLS